MRATMTSFPMSRRMQMAKRLSHPTGSWLDASRPPAVLTELAPETSVSIEHAQKTSKDALIRRSPNLVGGTCKSHRARVSPWEKPAAECARYIGIR
jgi:hypothetical protein